MAKLSVRFENGYWDVIDVKPDELISVNPLDSYEFATVFINKLIERHESGLLVRLKEQIEEYLI